MKLTFCGGFLSARHCATGNTPALLAVSHSNPTFNAASATYLHLNLPVQLTQANTKQAPCGLSPNHNWTCSQFVGSEQERERERTPSPFNYFLSFLSSSSRTAPYKKRLQLCPLRCLQKTSSKEREKSSRELLVVFRVVLRCDPQ